MTWIALVAIAVIATLTLLWLRNRQEPHPPSGAVGSSSFRADTLSVAAMEDRLHRASEQGHTLAALHWAHRLRASRPRHAPTLLLLSTALHDYAITSLPWNGALRPALRSSVERAAYEMWALALADSAAAASTDAPEWSKAVAWRGQMLEYLGFPLAALEAYREIERRAHGVPHATLRAYWLESHLRNPLLPDQIRVPRRVVDDRSGM